MGLLGCLLTEHLVASSVLLVKGFVPNICRLSLGH